jgi:anti-sigma factor RsiW
MHTVYRESIQELVDGTIGSIRRAELERHLSGCDDCRAFLADMKTIRNAAGSLDQLAPPDGVWLQIAGRLRQEGRVTIPPVRQRQAAPARHVALLAIAASLLLAVGAGIAMLLPQYRSKNAATTPPATTAAAPQPGNAASAVAVESVEAEFRLAEQHYQNAIAKLEQAARLDQAAESDRQVLDPQTAAMLQKNLQVIDQAIAESRSALRTEPLSAPARDSLFDALRRKVALLQDTIALMNEMRKGNSAGAAQIVEGANKS